MIKILGTGLSGLVGSRIVELLEDKYRFEDLSLAAGVDITDKSSVLEKIDQSGAPIIVHLAAKADVDGCEKDKRLGKEGRAWQINVSGTQNIVDACRKTHKKIIYISTDFVFDGTNPPTGGYSEEDVPHPINWYGQTKWEGEQIVKNSGLDFIIMRIAYPYRKEFPKKRDFVRSMIAKFENQEKVLAVSDHIMTPTFIDDIASALDILVRANSSGIYHVVGSQFVSPFQAASLVADIFGYDKKLIEKTIREQYFKDRAARPFHLALRNDKIQKLGVKMKTLREGLMLI
ncbi:SDR family oxidoreductase [Candidatus Microgenomates bacterium]|nr:SDR family oxidoreductase [Candidatus Microgenomates bacterium]